MSEHIHKRKLDTNECLNKYVWLIYSNIWMYLSHSVLNALRCYLRLKWYFSRICPALCLTDALSLPPPLPSLFMKGPGQRLMPNITTNSFLAGPSPMQTKSKSQFSESVIGCWFVRLLTMAADWVTCYVRNIWAPFLAPTQMDLENHSTTPNNILKYPNKCY